MPTLSTPDRRIRRPKLKEGTGRGWREKFREALQGIKWGIRGQSSFFVHFFFTAAVIVAAATFQCSLVEWCLLIGCIGFVLTAELFNSAIEVLVARLPEESRDQVWPALHIAAGAVLMASATAAIVGLIIFGRHLAQVLSLL